MQPDLLIVLAALDGGRPSHMESLPMQNYAVVEAATGKIINRIVLDADSEWVPPEGCSIVLEEGMTFEIGGRLRGSEYTPPTEQAK